METFLIIDGNNLLFQMFFGMPSKIYNKKGETIHATIGFISFVLKQVKVYGANKVCVVFDYDGSSDRKEEYSEYKNNRFTDWESLPQDEVPFFEEEKIKRCLSYLGIKYIDSINMEADDVIASLTYLFNKDHKVIISSFDSDFFQLINENTAVLRYRGKASLLYDINLFKEKMGFDPSKYVFYKSLVGDSSDNIKGIKGIGKVRATNIVNSCSNFSEFLAKNSTLLPKSMSINIEECRNIYNRNEKLIKLNYISSIVYSIEEFNYSKEKIKLTNSQVLSACNIFNE
ncbi:MAG: hypothetical protein E7177_06470 [Erysipelotrichaceae bacterium]|nr:hypothetical protein [Erysipelotrichaceae bacterium]